MKLLSNLENLDNITDGENRKLDIYYMDLTTSSSEPFVFNDTKPGLYINTNAHKRGYFYCKLNDSSTAVLNNNYSGHIYYMLITENPATAEDYTRFCYLSILNNIDITTNPGTAQLINYYQDIQKRSTVNAGVQRGGISKSPVGSMSAVISSAYSQNDSAVAAKTARYTALQDAIPADTYFFINMKLGNSAASALTLNINSKGAHPIYINGEPSSETNYTLPARPYLVYYDGTNYYFNTDGTIPRVIHGNDSIKRIVELDYEDYKELEDNDEVDPDTEYHIPESSINEQTIKKACKIVSFYRTSGWTTQSTTDVDIPNATATVTTNGGNVLVTVTTSLNVTGNMAFVALYVDDTLHSEILCLNATIGSQVLTASALVTNLNAGEHTFALKMHVQNTSNVGTVMTYNTQQMVIQEL